jgi:hypothetical protein
MKNKSIFWGIFFISIGIFILINNLSSFHFYFENTWRPWPVVLILLGISMLIKHAVIRSILVGFTAFVLAFALYSSVVSGFQFCNDGFVYDYDSDDFNDSDKVTGNYSVQKFEEDYNTNIKKATLNFDAGAGTFIIQDTTAKLIMAKSEGISDYSLSRANNGNDVSIDMFMKKKHFSIKNGKLKNKVGIKLNPNPEWDMNINVGASKTDLDLSGYHIRNLDIDMGAASLDVTLGMPLKETNFEIEAGVSSIHINIPEKAGCEIKTDVALSSKSFDGFKETSSNVYHTDNFNKAEKKIYIELKTGVSSINVKRISSGQ